MSVLFAILLFSMLIFVHELGHFLTAKLSGVQVNEFSMFMGPTLWSKKIGETQYSVRLIPVGGYCAMEGDDEDSDNPRSFGRAAWWKRILILAAGAAMNFLVGVLLMVIIYLPAKQAVVPVISGFESFSTVNGADGLQVGDKILELDGEKIYVQSDFSMLLRLNPGETHDLVVLRDGQKVALKDFRMETHTVTDDSGVTRQLYGMNFTVESLNLPGKLQYAWNQSLDTVRLVRLSLQMLLSGKAGIGDMTGPVGIVQQMAVVADESASRLDALMNMLYFGGFIAINLAVMNLLPIPALDGGRIVGVVITTAVEAATRKKINPKYEGYLHGAGMILLMALMAVIMFKDIFMLFRGYCYDKTDFSRRCAHRRRCPGGHPVHAQHQNHGCGGKPSADSRSGGGRLSGCPAGSAQSGGGQRLCGDLQGKPSASGCGYSL